jgi:hypothetical protein
VIVGNENVTGQGNSVKASPQRHQDRPPPVPLRNRQRGGGLPGVMPGLTSTPKVLLLVIIPLAREPPEA